MQVTSHMFRTLYTRYQGSPGASHLPWISTVPHFTYLEKPTVWKLRPLSIWNILYHAINLDWFLKISSACINVYYIWRLCHKYPPMVILTSPSFQSLNIKFRQQTFAYNTVNLSFIHDGAYVMRFIFAID